MLVERRTHFSPTAHGFAFSNAWSFGDADRAYLRRILRRYAICGAALGSFFFGVGALLIPLAVLVIRVLLERHLGPLYGLCGGMCFVALDYYRSGLTPIQIGVGERRPVPGTDLYRALWKRQVQSMLTDGARFFVWALVLNYVPSVWPFGGGPRWLLARSRKEWRRLRASIDAGDPAPIGLVRDRKNVFDNHQVLVFGYDELDHEHVILQVYDPNCPGRLSTISLEFGKQELLGRESCGADSALRGFFCESYRYVAPARRHARA
ncbi:MAG: hypothetical protein GX620_09805 [Chloroflexi bacterium]|nr:hypothetical protein [Chloroflexota bacterium]